MPSLPFTCRDHRRFPADFSWPQRQSPETMRLALMASLDQLEAASIHQAKKLKESIDNLQRALGKWVDSEPVDNSEFWWCDE